MAFTDRTYNLAGSGIVPVLMARTKAMRLLILGDSTTSEAVSHRFWEAWVCRSLPVQFNGFFTSAYMAGADWSEKSWAGAANSSQGQANQLDPMSVSYSITGYTIGADSVITMAGSIGLADGMTVWITGAPAAPVNGVKKVTGVSGATFKGNPAINTTGLTSGACTIRRVEAAFPNLITGLCPTLTQEWIWGATAVADNTLLATWTIHPYQAGAQTAYSHSCNVASPMWWMNAVDVSLIYFDPKLSVHGCTGADMDIYTCRLTEAPVKNGATVQHSDSGTVRVVTRSIAATTDGRKVPQVKIYNPPAGGALATDNRNTGILPWGVLWERPNQTKGLTVIPIGNAQWSMGDWGDSTAGPLGTGMPNDTVLAQFAAAVPVDGIVFHLGFNLTATQLTDLAAGNLGSTKTLIANDIARARSIWGDKPVLILSMYNYGRTNTVNNNILTAMQQSCDEISRVSVINLYHGVGDNQTFIDDAADMNPVTSGAADRHPSENGSAFFIGLAWEQVRLVDEAMGGGRGTRMAIGL